MWFAGPEIDPVGFGQIEMAGGGAFLGDGIDEQGTAEHELIADVADAGVGGEIHDEGAHGGELFMRDFPGVGINVGHEAVAEAGEIGENGLGFGAVGPEFVFVGHAGTVDAEDGQKAPY